MATPSGAEAESSPAHQLKVWVGTWNAECKDYDWQEELECCPDRDHEYRNVVRALEEWIPNPLEYDIFVLNLQEMFTIGCWVNSSLFERDERGAVAVGPSAVMRLGAADSKGAAAFVLDLHLGSSSSAAAGAHAKRSTIFQRQSVFTRASVGGASAAGGDRGVRSLASFAGLPAMLGGGGEVERSSSSLEEEGGEGGGATSKSASPTKRTTNSPRGTRRSGGALRATDADGVRVAESPPSPTRSLAEGEEGEGGGANSRAPKRVSIAEGSLVKDKKRESVWDRSNGVSLQLCFVSVHLPAKSAKSRQEAFETICSRLGMMLTGQDCNLTECFHHTVISGDFNFRVSAESSVDGMQAVEWLKTGRPDLLFEHDEFKVATRARSTDVKAVMPLFSEGDMGRHFYPTYKKIESRPATDFNDPEWALKEYKTVFKVPWYKGGHHEARCPGFCDRILMKTHTQLSRSHGIQCMPGSYRPFHPRASTNPFNWSDHSAVSSTLLVDVSPSLTAAVAPPPVADPLALSPPVFAPLPFDLSGWEAMVRIQEKLSTFSLSSLMPYNLIATPSGQHKAAVAAMRARATRHANISLLPPRHPIRPRLALIRAEAQNAPVQTSADANASVDTETAAREAVSNEDPKRRSTNKMFKRRSFFDLVQPSACCGEDEEKEDRTVGSAEEIRPTPADKTQEQDPSGRPPEDHSLRSPRFDSAPQRTRD
uniref:Inositol polyphosphate-related phosphatase domain-containing protein n=1 Tax=Chromera velia CCMP2878 TaxID=1169474 RepID=A0A0G4HCR0_9ALVE|eukprot:Cvel_26277.t1-p1 / transcript=Cvel_26277.t1 / gene=Cvel_26277 / organism=Chromera_velia_CCMP2878 / gene_product=hypothetical protein / transcript_product=hypothetical protein / location=Cvel_scaffold3102:4606-11181(-) / protein_length=709 / sequence_SO=supercontig / SO=protein_coding / is_pseudo=false